MSAETVKVFKDQMPVDLANPPNEYADWEFDNLFYSTPGMEAVVAAAVDAIGSPLPQCLVEIVGESTFTSAISRELHIPVGPVRLIDRKQGPRFEDLVAIFAGIRRAEGHHEAITLGAVIITDLVIAGEAAHHLATDLLKYANVKVRHVVSLVEDLREGGRALINSPLNIKGEDGTTLRQENGLSYTSLVKFDPQLGYIEGETTPGIKAENLVHSLPSSAGVAHTVDPVNSPAEERRERWYRRPSGILVPPRATHRFYQGPGFPRPSPR
jgi:hypothetical protein